MITLAQRIPVKVRKAIYDTLATAFGVELALDLVGWGFVEAELQGKIVIVAGALGFAIAGANTNKSA